MIFAANAAFAAGDAKHPRKVDWPFDGAFGTFDKQSAQRGLQVYKEVCSACHGLNRVAFRTLSGIGFSEGEIKALAANYTVKDGPNDVGEMFERPGLPSDKFVPPHANEQEARAAHNGAYPPDLSLIIKARHDGANYLYSLLTGYGQEVPSYSCEKTDKAGECIKFTKLDTSSVTDQTYRCIGINKGEEKDKETGKTYKKEACVKLQDGLNYNPYFPGGALAMAAPLSDGQVSYEDGTVASVDQMAKDLTVFLQWAAEPEMEQRKQLGLKVLAYLAIFTIFMYIAKRRIWGRLH